MYTQQLLFGLELKKKVRKDIFEHLCQFFDTATCKMIIFVEQFRWKLGIIFTACSVDATAVIYRGIGRYQTWVVGVYCHN